MNPFIRIKKDLSVLAIANRNYTIDNLRALAILMVVIHHFQTNIFKLGFLGVDVFFVLSGYLVSLSLFKELKNHNSLSFKNFYVKRIFKILPSYYSFLILGSIILFIYNFFLDQQLETITLKSLPYYVGLIQNYSGYKTFYHIWSLCVEEHFYIFLPITLFILAKIFKSNHLGLLLFIILAIIIGNLARVYSFNKGIDTYAATHNRIDALSWGVLAAFININFSNVYKTINSSFVSIAAVFIFFITLILTQFSSSGLLFQDVICHTLLPISIFLILLVSFLDLNRFNFKALSFISFYSYNWYLWHIIFIIPIKLYFDTTILSFIIYLLFTFITAVITTHYIEIPLLKKRKHFLQ